MTIWKFELKNADPIEDGHIKYCSWCQLARAFVLTSRKEIDGELTANQVNLCTSHVVTFEELMIEPEMVGMI
jgi:hypothetical protein